MKISNTYDEFKRHLDRVAPSDDMPLFAQLNDV